MKKISLLILFPLFFLQPSKQDADLLIYNAAVYTLDSNFSVAESFAVKDGKIIDVGTKENLLSKYDPKEKIDAGGNPVYPGFIDSHCHFLSYGLTFQRIDLKGTSSFGEVVSRVSEFNKKNDPEWINGRGWDQNDWPVKEFPDRAVLDSLFPDKPVYLRRIDGHAALVNGEALRRAGITPETKIEGGLVEVKDGRLTGILVDNAVDLVAMVVPVPTKKQVIKALTDAQENCFSVGLTTVDDAGIDKKTADIINDLQNSGKLKMRIYGMLSDTKENIDYYIPRGPYISERLVLRSFKFYADGALGSRGACLLEPYSDKPGHFGFLVSKPEYLMSGARMLYEKGFQMNTHCIGDSAVRLILDIYEDVLATKNDRRWRVEHAQVVNENDFEKFGTYQIIPSVQPTHATSDMYWAEERLGKKRVIGAYAYKQLLRQNGFIVSGSDFPVESINPLLGFYAAVTRQDIHGYPDGGFQPENALTREEALKSMTIWAAYSNFEENIKGSIEKGKLADFVILDSDIMNIDMKEIPMVKVLFTYVNGEAVYKSFE